MTAPAALEEVLHGHARSAWVAGEGCLQHGDLTEVGPRQVEEAGAVGDDLRAGSVARLADHHVAGGHQVLVGQGTLAWQADPGGREAVGCRAGTEEAVAAEIVPAVGRHLAGCEAAERDQHQAAFVHGGEAQRGEDLLGRPTRAVGEQRGLPHLPKGGKRTGERKTLDDLGARVGLGVALDHGREAGLELRVGLEDPVPAEVGDGERRQTDASRGREGEGRDVAHHQVHVRVGEPGGLAVEVVVPAPKERFVCGQRSRQVEIDPSPLEHARVDGSRGAGDRRLTPCEEPRRRLAADEQAKPRRSWAQRGQDGGDAHGVAEPVPRDEEGDAALGRDGTTDIRTRGPGRRPRATRWVSSRACGACSGRGR